MAGLHLDLPVLARGDPPPRYTDSQSGVNVAKWGSTLLGRLT